MRCHGAAATVRQHCELFRLSRLLLRSLLRSLPREHHTRMPPATMATPLPVRASYDVHLPRPVPRVQVSQVVLLHIRV
jgi:hypothetical protein